MTGALVWPPNCCVPLEKCQVLSFSVYKWRTGLFQISESCHILRLFGLVSSFWSSVEIPEYQQEELRTPNQLLSLVPWLRGCKATSEVLQDPATDLENGPSKCSGLPSFLQGWLWMLGLNVVEILRGRGQLRGGEQGFGPHVKKGGLEVNVHIPTILRILIINDIHLCWFFYSIEIITWFYWWWNMKLTFYS